MTKEELFSRLADVCQEFRNANPGIVLDLNVVLNDILLWRDREEKYCLASYGGWQKQ